uniref:THAP-type domain-containing protein n=1 Tax=Moschus moschiferus TaxID=68415 RepID=A0A8C6DBR4_MOSMO
MTRNTVLSRERGLSFHQFPTDTIQRSKWIRAVNRTDPRSKKIWIPGPGAMLCSIHFQESDFESYNIRRKLKKGAVPSVSLYKVLQGHLVELAALEEQELSHMERIPRKLANLKNHILKTNCATQVFSESVVKALECLLSLGLPSFKNCVGTIHFLRLIHNLFDIFNSRNFYGKGFKGPLLPETFNKINLVLTEKNLKKK